MTDILETQQAHQAPPPAFLKSVINQSKKEPQVEPGKDRDRLLGELSDTEAWKVLKRFIEAKQMMLAKELKDSIGNAGLEEVGFKFLILDQVNTFANQIITFVEAPREVAKLQHKDN